MGFLRALGARCDDVSDRGGGTRDMTPEQQQLLARIFCSRHFSYANALKGILQYLCEHAAGADAPSIKEHEIAVSALGRRESFDPRTDPVVRVSMADHHAVF